MARPATFLALLLSLALSAPAPAAERIVLENGLTVLLEPSRTAPAVNLSAFVKAGRIHEPARHAGISHFVEHMMFRATARRPHGGTEREVWRVGGNSSAFTREDFTDYGITLPSEHTDLALDILSDSLISATFDPQEVEEERKIVLDEVRRRAATPQTWGFEALQGLAFLPHPYGARIAGTPRTVASIRREDLVAYHRAHYRPDRTVLVVVGDFEAPEMLEKVRRAFGSWERSAGSLPPPPSPRRELGHYQETVVHRDGATPTLLVSIALPGYLHPDYLPCRFLRPILSGWMMKSVVSEKRAALTADIYFTQLKDRSLYSIRLPLADPSDAGKARDALLALFRTLRRPDFTMSSMSEVASNFRAKEILVGEDFGALAGIIGRAAICGYYGEGGRPERLAADDRYARITQTDVNRVLRAYLRPENLRVLFLLPPGAEAPPAADPALSSTPPAAFATAPEPARLPYDAGRTRAERPTPPPRESEAIRIELAGGATLLHLERPGVPVVAGTIMFRAGSRYDPPGLEGLAALTMKALCVATEGQPGIRWRLFSHGYKTDFSASRDTAQVTFTVPKEGVREVLHAVTEMLRNPAFTETAVEEARGSLLRSVLSAGERVGSFGDALFRQTILQDTGYDHEKYGTKKSLLRIRKEDVLAFYRKHLRLEDAVVALVGDIPPRTARALVQEGFSRDDDPVPRREEGKRTPLDWPGKPGEARVTHPSGRTYAILGTRAPSLSDPEYAEVSLLRFALGWQVFHEFTDVRSTAYRAGAAYLPLTRSGTFNVFVETTPARTSETLAVLRSFLRIAATDGFPPDLVEDAKGAWFGSAALSRMRSATVASRIAFREIEGMGYGSFDLAEARVDAITSAELTAFCARLFPRGLCFTLIVN